MYTRAEPAMSLCCEASLRTSSKLHALALARNCPRASQGEVCTGATHTAISCARTEQLVSVVSTLSRSHVIFYWIKIRPRALSSMFICPAMRHGDQGASVEARLTGTHTSGGSRLSKTLVGRPRRSSKLNCNPTCTPSTRVR